MGDFDSTFDPFNDGIEGMVQEVECCREFRWPSSPTSGAIVIVVMVGKPECNWVHADKHHLPHYHVLLLSLCLHLNYSQRYSMLIHRQILSSRLSQSLNHCCAQTRPFFNMASKKTPNITLYTAQTPNGIKISMALEELGLVHLLYCFCPYKQD